jgi:hypothetical protein
MADSFGDKRKAGLVQGHSSGFGGTGFKFDKEEDQKIKQARKAKAKVGGRTKPVSSFICTFFHGCVFVLHRVQMAGLIFE